MKKLFAVLLAMALLCGLSALAEAGEAAEASVKCAIEAGSYVIRIPDANGDLGWVADDMSQDDSVVKLARAGLEGDAFVVQYDPVGDGDIAVSVRHYLGIACDQAYTWEHSVKDGAIQECLGGAYTAAPDEAEQDPVLTGEWLESETQFSQLSIGKNEGRGWNVEIVSPLTHGAYVFKTTIYYDCDLDSFVYDKGKFWDVPITDGEEEIALGEAAVAGATGSFTLAGDENALRLTWHNDQAPGQEVVFEPASAEAAMR